MSFGFGVGDMIEVSRLAYKLYGYCKDGRRHAPEHYKTIEHNLSAIHCALNHLDKQTQSLIRAHARRLGAHGRSSPDSPSMDLTAQVASIASVRDNCKETLLGVEEFLKKYLLVKDNGPSGGTGPTGLGGVRYKVKTNLERIKFGTQQEKQLDDLNKKLALQTKGINLMLSSIIAGSVSSLGNSMTSLTITQNAQTAALGKLEQAVLDLNSTRQSANDPLMDMLKSIHSLVSGMQGQSQLQMQTTMAATTTATTTTTITSHPVAPMSHPNNSNVVSIASGASISIVGGEPPAYSCAQAATYNAVLPSEEKPSNPKKRPGDILDKGPISPVKVTGEECVAGVVYEGSQPVEEGAYRAEVHDTCAGSAKESAAAGPRIVNKKLKRGGQAPREASTTMGMFVMTDAESFPQVERSALVLPSPPTLTTTAARASIVSPAAVDTPTRSAIALSTPPSALLQITSTPKEPGFRPLPDALFDPHTNAAYAYTHSEINKKRLAVGKREYNSWLTRHSHKWSDLTIETPEDIILDTIASALLAMRNPAGAAEKKVKKYVNMTNILLKMWERDASTWADEEKETKRKTALDMLLSLNETVRRKEGFEREVLVKWLAEGGIEPVLEGLGEVTGAVMFEKQRAVFQNLVHATE